MLSGAGGPRLVRVQATITHDGGTVPMDVNPADVSTTKHLVTGAGQRHLTLVMRSGERVVLLGDEADRFERIAHGAPAPAHAGVDDLTPEQRRYLQALFDHFHATGAWPTYWALGRKLVRDLDVQRVAESLPPGLTNAGAVWEAAYNRGEGATEAILTVPALRLCQGAQGELGAFLATLRLCVDRHLDPELDEPELTTADLRESLGFDELMVRKAQQLLRGEPDVLGNGGGVLGSDAWRVAVSGYIGRYREVRTIDDYVAARPAPAIVRGGLGGGLASVEQLATSTAAAPPRVFLVHGHHRAWREETARFLERLGLEVTILDEQPSAGRTIIENFEHHADVRYAVALLTGDDRGGPAARPYKAQRARARQNVIFELGYFAARLGRRHVCVLHEPDVEIPSDYQGVLYVSLDDAGAWRSRLVRELREAGLPLDPQQIAAVV